MKHLTALVCVGFALLGGNAFAGDYINSKTSQFWGDHSVRYKSTDKEIQKNGFGYLMYRVQADSELYNLPPEKRDVLRDVVLVELFPQVPININQRICVKTNKIACYDVPQGGISKEGNIMTYLFAMPYKDVTDHMQIQYIDVNGKETVGNFSTKSFDFQKLR